MSTRFRKLVTLLLVISMMPGWASLLENLEHIVHDGHLAHAADHRGDVEIASHQMLEAEHGCTPMQHTCSCHVSMPALLSYSLNDPLTDATLVARVPPVIVEQHPASRANAPPVPPPLA